ncbi:MAG: pitrilysin family protein [Anaerolineae bacterium]
MTDAPIGPHTIQRFTLANGIKLIVQENHVSPSVVVRGHLWVGSVNDPPEKMGLAHFTASTVRRGTTTRTYQEINEITESVGAHVYVSGGRHLTSFGGKSLAEDFTLLIDILADVLLNPSFPQNEVDKARGQIITGLRELENDTRSLANREFRQLLYTQEHPYGRPGDGTLDSIPGIQRDDLQRFYHTHYHPQGAAIVVVGDVQAESVRDTLERAIGGWQPAGEAPIFEVPAPQPLTELRRYVRTMTNKTQADLVLGTVGPDRAAEEYYAARLGDTILGHLGLMGRLGESVRDQQGLAYYAYSGLEAGLGRGPWSVRAGVNPANVDKAISSILAEIRRLRDEPVTDQELEDGQDYLTGSLPLRLETNEGIANTLLDMDLYQLGDDYIIRFPDLIRSVTREQIQAAAQKYLDPEHYALAIVGPYEEK